MDILLLIAQFGPILILIYLYINRKFNYWSKLGVVGPTPSLLQLGNLSQIAGSNKPSENEVDLVEKYGKIYGTYAGLEPVLTVADPEWIKTILVKDFPLFINHRQLRAYHEYVNSNLFFSEGDDWKRLRTIMSPSFSTGKLRAMHSMMNKCVEKLNSYLRKVATTGDGVIQTKEVIAGLTTDVIALTSFALETDSNGDLSKQNPFLKHLLQYNDAGKLQALSYYAMPKWFNKLVKVEHIADSVSLKYLQDMSAEILKQRKSSNSVKRNDFMQLLMDASVSDHELKSNDFGQLTADAGNKDDLEIKEDKKVADLMKNTLTDKEIIAQSILFLVAGFETTASAITNCIFELSQNPDVQERLFQELTQHLAGVEVDSDQYYDIVMQQIPYFDAVIKETLRKYPPLVRLERRVMVDNYKVNGIPLHKNQLVEISTMAVHYNPQYYPQPHTFNPDRFMPSNRHYVQRLLVPYTFVPFGAGPRNCIGMRFAYQEIKLCLSQIVRQFRFSPTAQTPKKLEFEGLKLVLFVKPFTTKIELR